MLLAVTLIWGHHLPAAEILVRFAERTGNFRAAFPGGRDLHVALFAEGAAPDLAGRRCGLTEIYCKP